MNWLKRLPSTVKPGGENGHDGRGQVTLMLHTLVGDDIDEVREILREPMKVYLRSAVGLIKQAAWTFPTFQAAGGSSGQKSTGVFGFGRRYGQRYGRAIGLCVRQVF